MTAVFRYLELRCQFWAFVCVDLDCLEPLWTQLFHEALQPLHHDLTGSTPGG
jgi:hypothetical protein